MDGGREEEKMALEEFFPIVVGNFPPPFKGSFVTFVFLAAEIILIFLYHCLHNQNRHFSNIPSNLSILIFSGIEVLSHVEYLLIIIIIISIIIVIVILFFFFFRKSLYKCYSSLSIIFIYLIFCIEK